MRGAIAILAATAAVVVTGSPFPQGVTTEVAPSGSAPAGCSTDYPGYFGLAVKPLNDGKKLQHVVYRREARPQVITSISDGQVQAPTGSPTMSMSTPLSTAAASNSVSLSNSGSTSTQVSSSPGAPTTGGFSSFSSTTTVTMTSTITIDCTTTTTMSKIGSSTSMIPVSQISDGQIQATNATPPPRSDPSTISVDPVYSIPDGQLQLPSGTRAIAPRKVFEVLAEGAMGFYADAVALEAQATPVACESNKTLSVRLRHGVLTDHHGRTGYIASNYQFQFDAPPQSGALYTAGFTQCSNGSLALGGSTVFWQCLSGNFYNLYDRYWAPQCEPIELVLVKLLHDC